MKNTDNIKINLMKLDEYIKKLEQKKETVEKENYKKRLFASKLKKINKEDEVPK